MSDRGFDFQFAAESGIAQVTLHRPPGNRISLGMLTGLLALFRTFQERSDLRAVVLTAEGKDFSHGADLQDPALAELIATSDVSRRSLAETGAALVRAWSQLPVPTVVSARGRTIGAGACLFAAADFRFTGPSFGILFPEVDRGMHLSWGILPHMAREFGWAATRRLALAGETLTGGELGDAVRGAGDPDAEAMRFAESLAAKPPLAVRSIKKVLLHVAAESALPDDAALFAETVGSADFAEAMSAWFEKRQAKYQGK